MAYAMIFFPILMGALAFAWPRKSSRPWLLVITGLVHLAMTIAALSGFARAEGSEWLKLDAPGKLVLLVISSLFAVVSFYAVGYLKLRRERPTRVFCACLCALLGTMTLTVWSNHLGLMWVAVEASSLASAPLIYFNRTARSIEATWKYMIVSSVGIAMALLGSFFLAYAGLHRGLESSLRIDRILEMAPQLSPIWLRSAFALLLVGYGTKMGLAPMHTWKPDAYGEAPGLVGALLAGGVTNCAFLALLRIHGICVAAGQGAFSSRLLIAMGLFSMLIAGVFMLGQRDFKRMLAYASVENVGLMSLGLGVGGPMMAAALLQMIGSSLGEAVLFLSGGNIHRAFGAKTLDRVRGAMRWLPTSAALFLLGFFAVSGAPPFSVFVSKVSLLGGSIAMGHPWVGGLSLLFMLLVFVGMGSCVLGVIQGPPPEDAMPKREPVLVWLPPLVLLVACAFLGLAMPEALRHLIDLAVIGGRP